MKSGQSLRAFVELASARAEKLFYKYGYLAPIWHYVDRKGDHHVMPAPDTDKDIAVMLVRALFELHGVTRYVFIDEAWIASAKTDPEARKIVEAARTTGLADYPGRQEIIMIAAEDTASGHLQGRRLIERPPGGKPKLGPLIIDEGGRMEGRLIGLLPKPTAAKTQ